MKKLIIGLTLFMALAASAESYKCTVNTGSIVGGLDTVIVEDANIEVNGLAHIIKMKRSSKKGVVITITKETDGLYAGLNHISAKLKNNLSVGTNNFGSDIDLSTFGNPGSVLAMQTFDWKSDLLYNLFCTSNL